MESPKVCIERSVAVNSRVQRQAPIALEYLELHLCLPAV